MSNEKTLHIICHDVPWPADYGGVVDPFYKIKTLSELGIKVHLHCFLYARTQEAELNRYCEEVHYYKRKTGWKGISFSTPYIVNSRAVPALLENLLKDDHPVLMEGIHCTAFVKHLMKHGKRVFLRLLNVESVYYRQLYKYERNIFKKTYYLNESVALKKYEKRLPQGLPVFTLSQADAACYQKIFGLKSARFLPAFIPYHDISGMEGKGNYDLYHGNLSVAENEKAAIWLIKNVFSKISQPLVIAGKNPSRILADIVSKSSNISLVANPTDDEMNNLIRNAHINVLPSFNNTGIKLKLINALYNGRHCVVNPAGVSGSDLDAACHVGTNADAIASIITQLSYQPFAEEEIALRKKLLPAIFDNKANAEKLIQWIW